MDGRGLNRNFRGKRKMKFETNVKTVMSLSWLACFTVYLSLVAGVMADGKAYPLLFG
jgi:hypothetical protein